MSQIVFKVAPLSKADIERKAKTVLVDFAPALLREPGQFPVIEFFEGYLQDKYQLDTGVEPLGDGVLGVAYPDGRLIISEHTYNSARRNEGRARFTISHEAGHGIIHRHQIRDFLAHQTEIALHRRQNIPAYVDPEWQADWFAASLMMPALMVSRLCEGVSSFQRPYRLMEVFGVSRQCAIVRLNKLGMA